MVFVLSFKSLGFSELDLIKFLNIVEVSFGSIPDSLESILSELGFCKRHNFFIEFCQTFLRFFWTYETVCMMVRSFFNLNTHLKEKDLQRSKHLRSIQREDEVLK